MVLMFFCVFLMAFRGFGRISLVFRRYRWIFVKFVFLSVFRGSSCFLWIFVVLVFFRVFVFFFVGFSCFLMVFRVFR